MIPVIFGRGLALSLPCVAGHCPAEIWHVELPEGGAVGSQIAFTSITSNTYVAIIIGHVEAGLVQKHYISSLSMPVMVFTCQLQSKALVVSGQWKPMQWHASH